MKSHNRLTCCCDIFLLWRNDDNMWCSIFGLLRNHIPSSITYPTARRWIRCQIHRGEYRGATNSLTKEVSSIHLYSSRWIWTSDSLTKPWDKDFILHVNIYLKKKFKQNYQVVSSEIAFSYTEERSLAGHLCLCISGHDSLPSDSLPMALPPNDWQGESEFKLTSWLELTL